MISEDEKKYAEDEKNLLELPEWQRESVELAEKIMYSSSNQFLLLPEIHEVNEYRIMEHFIMTLELGKVRDDLWNAIKVRGAFRRFKDRIYYHGLDQEWYTYRDEAFKRFAREWCESKKIEYVE